MRYYKDKNGDIHQLQRCPFCGMEVAEPWSSYEQSLENGEEPNRDIPERFTVVCNFNMNGCGATCGYHDDIYKAISRWNTRVVI